MCATSSRQSTPPAHRDATYVRVVSRASAPLRHRGFAPGRTRASSTHVRRPSGQRTRGTLPPVHASGAPKRPRTHSSGSAIPPQCRDLQRHSREAGRRRLHACHCRHLGGRTRHPSGHDGPTSRDVHGYVPKRSLERVCPSCDAGRVSWCDRRRAGEWCLRSSSCTTAAAAIAVPYVSGTDMTSARSACSPRVRRG